MSDNHGQKLVNLNEPDEPAIGTVYLIMIITAIFLVVTFTGLYAFNGVMDQNAENAVEENHTSSLKGKVAIEAFEKQNEIDKANAAQLKTVEEAINKLP